MSYSHRRYLYSSRTIFYFASCIIYDDVLIFCCSSQYILFFLIFPYLLNRLSGRALLNEFLSYFMILCIFAKIEKKN